ncbi:unnamed protein product [Paramecium sonneborni]|uniref:Transmembrane protein n=1 Tax=Paramecium sonneborni TaxID=65129 RepID=A0A8S1R5Z8_9CILI|nr:unnamed protein product [Paramecium sonneborni]
MIYNPNDTTLKQSFTLINNYNQNDSDKISFLSRAPFQTHYNTFYQNGFSFLRKLWTQSINYVDFSHSKRQEYFLKNTFFILKQNFHQQQFKLFSIYCFQRYDFTSQQIFPLQFFLNLEVSYFIQIVFIIEIVKMISIIINKISTIILQQLKSRESFDY